MPSRAAASRRCGSWRKRRDGDHSERRISRQRTFAPPAGEAKPDWWAVSEVAKRMGFGAAFDYPGPAAIFREHAALSAFENNGTRDFDLGGLAGLSDTDYDALSPLQWPVPVGGAGRTKRMFADGRFFTPSGRARFIAIEEPALAEEGVSLTFRQLEIVQLFPNFFD